MTPRPARATRRRRTAGLGGALLALVAVGLPSLVLPAPAAAAPKKPGNSTSAHTSAPVTPPNTDLGPEPGTHTSPNGLTLEAPILPTVPLPAGKKYVNTTQCVTNSNSGAKLKNGVSWAQTQLDYTSLWDLGKRGAGQTIAVIDTGINPISALAGRVRDIGDYVVPSDFGGQDCDGHGTIVASLIAASPDSATGFAGVAPDAKLLAIRQSSLYYGVKDAKQGSDEQTAGNVTSLAAAIRYAVDNGATVINISEANCRPASSGSSDDTTGISDQVQYAVDHDVVVVVAAGNVEQDGACKTQNTPGADPVTIASPADAKGVLAVAAVDESGSPAAFSLNGPWVGVAAPGVDIVASNPVATADGQINQLITGNGVSPIQGTSFSTPYVAGLAALVRARFPKLTAPEVIERIERTAQHPAAPGGRNDLVGYGMIDPAAALTASLPGEAGASVTPRNGPSVLPAAVGHTDPDRKPRRIALIGSLALLVVITSGAIAMSTRARRREHLAAHSAGRALG